MFLILSWFLFYAFSVSCRYCWFRECRELLTHIEIATFSCWSLPKTEHIRTSFGNLRLLGNGICLIRVNISKSKWIFSFRRLRVNGSYGHLLLSYRIIHRNRGLSLTSANRFILEFVSWLPTCSHTLDFFVGHTEKVFELLDFWLFVLVLKSLFWSDHAHINTILVP